MPHNIKFTIAIVFALVLVSLTLSRHKTIMHFNNNAVSTALIRVKTKDVVFVKCKFRHAGVLSNSAEQHGISVVVGNLIFRKLGNLSVAATQVKLRELGICSLNVDSEGDDFIISCRVLKPKAIEAIRFVFTALTDPFFTKNDLAFVAQRLPHILEIETAHPRDLLVEKMESLLYKNHNYGKNTTGTTLAISKITEDDIRDYMRQHFVKKNLEIVFAGDISAADVCAYTNAITEKLEDGDRNIYASTFAATMSPNKLEIINKPNMNDIVGVAFGCRIDNITATELAAVLMLTQLLFDKRLGSFYEGMKGQDIAGESRCYFRENRYSTELVVYSFIDKQDVEKYWKYLLQSLTTYKSNCKLKGIASIKRFFINKRELGTVSLHDIDEETRRLNLPFEAVSSDLLRNIAGRLFDKVKFVIIGDEVSLPKLSFDHMPD